MTREEFLSTTWKRYPVLPEWDLFVGRVFEMAREKQGYAVSLERHLQVSERRYPSLTLLEASSQSTDTFEVMDIIVAGDLVAISSEGIVTLVAPRQAVPLQRTMDTKVLKLWQDFLYWLNQFFREQGFLEVATPSLVPCPGTEPTLDYFKTELEQGSKRTKYYLPTSPELHLKKALSLGAEKIFEVRRCFRNGEITQHHQPEFTMIEWYRAFAGLPQIQKDVQDLVSYLTEKMPELKAPTAVEIFSVRDLFQKNCGFDLLPSTSLSELKSLGEKLQIDLSSATTIDDAFFLIFMEKIEAAFPLGRMTFVQDYPPYQAALARISKEGWGERFEMYWQGLEIANAFHELNDPEVQQKRFEEDLAKKKVLGKETIPLDPEFIQCLFAGMPPSSGIALGVERLFMALTGIDEISKTRLFPLK